ncbi:hypothetical protein [Bacillus solimangrovi]|uniref:Uncharacterized protein n=1 Tax=Bacillus solimangrovi TaxID=1305675 RepID=A0A1E5LBX7_9BACI|nr:hypothetical protein [Bacillus solimangrovi]OEH91581.1 hypothetical protein BFG57_04190 [Bacillus solimangrovi]
MVEYVRLISTVLLFLIIFYQLVELVRLHHTYGVMRDSNMLRLFTIGLALVQPLFMFTEYIIDIFFVLGAILLYSMYKRFYAAGPKISVHRTTENELLDKVRETLKSMDVPFHEEQRKADLEHIFVLPNEKTTMKLTFFYLKHASKKPGLYSVTLMKAWKVPWKNEFEEELRNQYKDFREGEIFWGEMISSLLFFIGGVAFIIYMLTAFY